MSQEIEKSIEIPNSGGARKSRLVQTGDNTILYIHDDVTTLWEVLKRGQCISGDSRCLGWRAEGENYSWITYNEFVTRVKNLGWGLLRIGMKSGQESKVGIYANNCVEFLVMQYACIKESVVVVPLYDTLGPKAFADIVNQAEIEVVFCDTVQKMESILEKKQDTPTLKHIVTCAKVSAELHSLATERDVRLHLMGYVEKLGESNPSTESLPNPDDICIICYTSGTTGDSKGVVLSHKNVVSAVGACLLQMGKSALRKTDTLISYLPLAHMFEQIIETLMFMVGGSIGYFQGDINTLMSDVRVLQPTFLPAVPRLLNKIYDQAQNLLLKEKIPAKSLINEYSEENRKNCLGKKKFLLSKFYEGLGGKIRLVVSGAAPVSSAILEFFETDLGIEIMEAYGQTENSGPCSLSVGNQDSSRNVGPPLACNIVKLIDVPDMEYYSKDGKGEICLKGTNVFQGYFKNPHLTSQVLDKEGWLHTGDIGMWTQDGCLKIIDRKKHILKLSQGEYLSPEKIENVYTLSPYISQIMVHGDSLKDSLVAVVIPDENVVAPLFKEKLRAVDWNEICKSQIVKNFLLEEVRRIGEYSDLNSLEQVKAIHLHPELCTYEKGFLTPTLKVKRAYWKAHFQKELDVLYDELICEKYKNSKHK